MSKVSRWHAPDGKERINWETIVGLPLGEFEKGERDISTLDDWIELALHFKIDESDKHFSDARYSSHLARLYRLVLSKCDHDANEMFSQKEEQSNAIEKVKQLLSVAEERVQRLLDEKGQAALAVQSLEDSQEEMKNEQTKLLSQIQSLQGELRSKDREIEKNSSDTESLRKELNRMTRERDDLRRASESREADASRSDADRNKIFDENQFLVKRYKEVSDKLNAMSESHAKLDSEHNEFIAATSVEVGNLRSQISALQQENLDLTQSRNKAEELCERRETQALQDMSELQSTYKDLLSEEQRRYQELRDEYLQLRDEFELNQRTRTQTRELEERDDQIVQLREEIQRLRTTRHNESELDSTRSSTVFTPTTNTTEMAVLNKVMADRQKLEQENDSLKGDLASLEVKCEQQDAQILKLQKHLNEYERGDEGLRRLRQELADGNRATEQLQDEAQQLRERLAHMEDVAAFCTSLKLLCRRVGVTQDEIDRLEGSTNSRFGELDILRQETASLKEEIEWLEKERRYWMNKVRLQPLLDTRLRFELGLSSEQLKQLDAIVDQMKSGSSVVAEDTEGVYREKYLREVQERQKDAEDFNAKMRSRIEEVLSVVLACAMSPTSENASASGIPNTLNQVVDEMRRHTAEVMLAASGATVAAQGARPQQTSDQAAISLTNAQSTKQLDSLRHNLEELERANADFACEANTLRERIASLEGRITAVSEERDAYRTIVFDAASGTSLQHPMVTSVSSSTPSRRYGGDTASPVLKEQLKSKELRLQQVSMELETTKAQVQVEKDRACSAVKENDVLNAKIKTMMDQLKSAASSIQLSSEQVSELEKINHDLRDMVSKGDLAPSTRELMQKIVLLRQREGKLIQRIRIASQERNEAVEAQERLERYVEATLNEMKAVLEGTKNGLILPPSAAQHASETEALRVLQHQLTRLSEGPLFIEDQAYVVQLREQIDRMEFCIENQTTQTELRALKKEMDARIAEAQERLIEVEARSQQRTLEPSAGGGSSELEAEANTWRQKCALYAKRLADRDADIAQLEEQLAAARQQVTESKRETSELQKVICIPEQTTAGQVNPLAPTELLKIEKEVSRLKSVNIGLLQTSLDLQADKKRLSIQLNTAQRHIQLLKDASGNSQAVNDFVVAALKDNSNLQQNCELAQYQLKKMRLQLLATESNFRVVANEAGAYKLSAHRLFKSYAEQVVRIVDAVRQLRRNDSTTVSARRADALLRRVAQSLQLAEQEHLRFEQERLRSTDLELHINALKDELEIASKSAGRTTIDAEKSKLVEMRAQLKTIQRQKQQASEERDFVSARLSRIEACLIDAEKEIVRLESSDKVAPASDDAFIQRLQELRDTVFAKSEAPPIAITMVPQAACVGQTEDSAVREFREALEKQGELSKKCTQLQQQAVDLRNQASLSESKAAAFKEEIEHLQQQLVAATHQIDNERGRAAQREERLTAAHKSQLEITQRAVEHNTQCLKDLIGGKERTIQQLQQQLQAERQRYLEHQLLDTTKMERLHEQLFRENNAMMERFKMSIDESSTAAAAAINLNAPSAAGVSTTHFSHNQLQALTQESMQLRMQIKELRTRNIMLETQLNDQITHTQQQVTALRPNASSVVEDTLMSVNRDQSVALENVRRREHELLAELQRSQEEVKKLHTEIFDLRNQLIEQVDAVAREHQARVAAGLAPLATATHLLQTPPNLAQELRAQITALSTQLQDAQAQLAYERAHLKHATAQTDDFKKAMQQMDTDIAQGTLHVEHAKQILATNHQLRADIDAMKDQHEKLYSATAFLKQKLVEQTQHASEREQKLQQEIALAQRMTVIQQQTSDAIVALQSRIASLQEEAQHRVSREEELLRKGKSAQQFAEEQHRQLFAKDKELIDLKRELQHLRSTTSTTASGKKLPAKRITWVDAGVQVISSELYGAHVGFPTSPQSNAPPPLPVAGVPLPLAKICAEASTQCEGTNEIHPTQSSSHVYPTSTDNGPKPVAVLPSTKASKAQAKDDMPSDAQVLPHVAGVVSRQVLQAQKEKQLEIDLLKQQVRRLEVDLAEAQEKFERDKNALVTKLNASVTAMNQMKSKMEQAEHEHRMGLLKFLEERHQASTAVAGSKPKRRPTMVARELGTQTENLPLQSSSDGAATVAIHPTGAPTLQFSATEEHTPKPTATTPQPGASAASLGEARVLVSKACQADVFSAAVVSPDPVKGEQTKKWVELQSASSDLKLQEMIRKLRKDNEKLNKQLTEAQAAQKELQHLQEVLKSKSEENVALQAKIHASSALSEQTSPLEIRSHKREILRLEEYIDQLRRDINVKKEVELRELILQNDRLRDDNRRLEAEVSALRGAAEANGALPAPQEPAATADSHVRELESRLLAQEGMLLDLRFERETLAMKVLRLERHLSDISAVDNAAKASAAAPGPNVGKSLMKLRKDPNNNNNASPSKDLTALEGVIENMKLVVERLQNENMSLRANSVSSSQFMEAMRDVKALRHRERQMLEKIHQQHNRIEELQAAVLPGSKMSEHVAALQRRLRMAQSAADQYQIELHELRSRLALQQQQPQPTSSDFVATSPRTQQSLALLASAEAPSLPPASTISPHSADMHHLLSHHHLS